LVISAALVLKQAIAELKELQAKGRLPSDNWISPPTTITSPHSEA